MPTKPMIVVGSKSNDEAKIGGMTPAVLIFSGKNERSPIEMPPPATCRFGYWITSRRSERSMKTTNTITASSTRPITRMAKPLMSPLWTSAKLWKSTRGNSATMPAKMISDTPLPTPRAVTCSPNHIRNIVPPVSVMTVDARKKTPGFVTTPALDCRPMAMP